MKRKGIFFIIFFMIIGHSDAYASNLVGGFSMPSVDLEANVDGNISSSLQMLVLLTLIALAPSMLIMMTSFTRILIALHFVRSALGTQQTPSNQILVGLTLFLTMFIMGPVFDDINENAIKPYSNSALSSEEFLTKGMAPIREFMFKQVENDDIALFIELSRESYEKKEDIPNSVLIPSFIMGEITKGFKFGILVFIPFIVIDMVVASILMAMGMMMLPPSMISLPFKIMIFTLAGGWNIILENLIKTFRM